MSDNPATTVPSEDPGYYSNSYWNHFPFVYRRLNRRATGNEDVFWYQQLLADGHHFKRALVLNCGNGWVERELCRIGLVDEVVGIDISTGLLDEARTLATGLGYHATYVEMDINRDPLPNGPFDLVLNYAACHHISSIDKVTRQIRERLLPDGLFVSWDYIGPHRNQYTAQQWEAAWQVNRRLPARFQHPMDYPDLDVMLTVDATEAVHSELIVPTMKRYFDIETFRPLGGAIGYLVLTHNMPFYTEPEANVTGMVQEVMNADEEFLDQFPDATLFAYVVARPKTDLPSAATLEGWTQHENEREAASQTNGGKYYDDTLVGHLQRRLEQAVANVSIRHIAAKRYPRLAVFYRRRR